jgi:proteasome accessory factor A
MTAMEIQWQLLEHARKYERERGLECVGEDVGADVLHRWEEVLTGLEADRASVANWVDWVAKERMLLGYMERHGIEWGDPRLRTIDLQYHDIRPGRGLYGKLEESEAVERLVTDDEISKAIYDPPKDTRAYFRGMCLQRYADEIVSASWDSVIFDLKEGPLKKIFMLEPLRGTEAHVRQLLTESPTAADLLRNISRPSYGV